MPEHLADLLEGCAGRQHLGGGSVTEPVRPDLGQPDVAAGPPHDRGDSAAPERPNGCERTEEESPVLGPRSPSLQIGGDRPTDVGGERKAVEPGTLACDGDLPDAPVEIVKSEACHLARAKPESQKDRQHGVVTAPDVAAEIAGAEQCCSIGATDPHRQRRTPSTGHRERCCRKVVLEEPLEEQVAEEGS